MPFTFNGSKLVVNYCTSAAGSSLRVTLQHPDGSAVPEFSLQNCETHVGDTIEGHISWQGNPDLATLADKPVRLRFVMKECDLYSFRFQQASTSVARP